MEVLCLMKCANLGLLVLLVQGIGTLAMAWYGC